MRGWLRGRPRDWLIPRSAFPATRYEGSDADERRLFYVAMTRARDLLFISTHERVTTQRSARSPYFLEIGGASLEPSLTPITLPAWNPEPASTPTDVPTFSFSEIAAYLACPKSYRYREGFGFAPAAAKELGYGKSVHHVLRRIAERTRAVGRVPASSEVARIFASEFFLPYADRPSHEKLSEHARELVETYMEHFRDDLLRVWEVERSFELHLGSANVTGRADVILDGESGTAGSLALVDYKTKADPARDPATELQLRVYAAAARGEGLDVRAAYVHELCAPAGAARTTVSVSPCDVDAATEQVSVAAERIRARRLDPCRGKACAHCDVRKICSPEVRA